VIPRHLKITGFLSYRDPVEIDFDRFDLACISGRNGAGKSSLLDGMTWALFGEPATGMIGHQPVQTAEVVFIFG
jgi:exonuclease SbcC